MLCTWLGCSNELNDLFCDGPGCGDAGDDASIDSGSPPLREFPDVGPYLEQPECAECLEQECAPSLDACRANESCAAYMACRATCRDPACHAECSFELVGAEGHANDVNQAQHWAVGSEVMKEDRWRDLWKCVVTSRCDQACALGRDFGCVGKWDPPTPFREGDEIQQAVAARDLVDGVAHEMSVAACVEADLQCESPVVTAQAVDGFVDLSLHANDLRGFRGQLRFDVTDQADAELLDRIPTSFHWASMPLRGLGFEPQLLYSHGLAASYWTAMGFSFDPDHPATVVTVLDCANDLVPGARVETDIDCAPFERCDFYFDRTAIMPGLEESLRGGVASILVPAPADSMADLRFIDADTGRLFARYTRIAPKGSHISAWVAPLTRVEQQQLEATDAPERNR